MKNRGQVRTTLARALSVPAILASVFVALLLGTAFNTSTAAALPDLKVQGEHIVEKATGKTVRLRGFKILSNTTFRGLGDRQPKAAPWVFKSFMPLTQAHYNQIKRWGANTVAFEIWWTGKIGPSEHDPEKPGVYDQQGLEMLRQHIRMAKAAGLYAMVLVRVCYDKDEAKPGSFTGWATHDYVVFNKTDAAGKRGLDRFKSYLSWLTRNIKDESNLIAVNPWQFPYHRQGRDVNAERERRYYQRVVPAMIDVIRQHTDKMIVISPPGLGRYNYNKHPGAFGDKNIIYGTGGYGRLCCLKTAQIPGGPDWDYDVSKLNHPHPSWKRFQTRYHVPMMSLEGPGLKQHSWPEQNGVPQLPKDRLALFSAVLDVVNKMNGWLVQDYGYPDAFSVLLCKAPNNRACEGAVVDRIQDALTK